MSAAVALIVGARGQLGRALVATAPDPWRVVALGREDLDLTDAPHIRTVVERERPAVVLNAAAYALVDQAEREPELAHAVNARGPGDLAAAAHAVGARMIHVSTDCVFDGSRGRPWRPDDEPNPINTYGRSKLDGERRVLRATAGRGLVVRTSWLHSSAGVNFPHIMLRLMRERDVVRVVADNVGSPTWTVSLARMLWAAAARPDVSGVLHWTDAGVASRFDFAVALQEEALALGVLERAVPLVPVRGEDFPEPAKRPQFAVLDMHESVQVLGLEPRHWRIYLRQMLRELAHA